MDDDSSTKFIESLTKFLQSLCNGYVEFQRGVELVGHIYLSVDTGEKVDYILHEKVSKNDENSVTFVSNSFHALPKEKDKSKAPANAGISKTLGPKGSSDDDDDDDIVIVDQPDNVLGSTNSGTLPYRGLKRVSSASSDHRRPGVSLHRSPSGGSSYQSSPWRKRQPSGPAATAPSQENISIGEVKLEQISSDELLTLASQVDDGASSSQGQGRPGGGGQSDHGSFSSNDAPGQAWIKQEPMDETQRGLDTVVFEDVQFSWKQLAPPQQRMMTNSSSSARKAVIMRRYREKMKSDPVRYRKYLEKQKEYARRSYHKMKHSAVQFLS